MKNTSKIGDRMKKISSHMEDYLEVIAELKKKKVVARVKDISQRMDVATPSVTSALNTLSREGLIIHERYGYVELTPDGERIASGVQHRHDTLIKFLTEILDIDPKIAREDACKMEHSISPETLEKLTKFVDLLRPVLKKKDQSG